MVHDIARKFAVEFAICGMVFCSLVSATSARAQTVTTTVFSGAESAAVAVNPVTNKIYIANENAGTVTVIDGATNNTASVSVGSGPDAIAVNPLTNQIYVANLGGSSVTVIDGPTNTTTTLALPAGSAPDALAVNATTNTIFAGDIIAGAGSVTVINGASDSPAVTATIATSVALGAGNEPAALGVNPLTNVVYVATQSGGANGVIVINGTTNSVSSTVATGNGLGAIAVNPVTNTIYVANQTANNVTVINGSTNGTTTVGVGTTPAAVAVNPVTALVYVANSGGAGSVSVISGTTVSATITGAGIGPTPSALAINPVTNVIYVANYSNTSGAVSAINGATNTVSVTLPAGTGPHSLAVNPVTNKIYAADFGDSSVVVIDGATNSPTAVAVGTSPFAGAADSTSNQVYIANFGSANVSVFNGTTNTVSATVAVGTDPVALAVNPLTNRVYVANQGGTVTEIDATTTPPTPHAVTVGAEPVAVAVNPLTNKIYVANEEGNSVSVIDGSTNSTTTVSVGTSPTAVAVNPVTDKIYVTNLQSNSVTVIDGASNTTSTVTVGSDPSAVVVNTVTNKIYVANFGAGTVTVINGATNSTLPVAVGSQPVALGIDEFTNTIYVVNEGSSNVTIINGATNNTISVSAGIGAKAIAVNAVTNKIYVANSTSGTVTVIDGATNSVSTVNAGNSPGAVVVNRVTNTIYVPNDISSGTVTIFPEAAVQSIPLTTTITPLAANEFIGTTPPPTFSFTTASTFAPNAPAVSDVYLQTDTFEGPWIAATGSGNSFSGQTGSLAVGTHILYAYAADAQLAIANGLSSPLIGNVSAYVFTIIPEGTSTTLTSNAGNPNTAGSSITFTATVTPSGGAIPTGNVTFSDGTTALGAVAVHTVGVTGVAAFSISTLPPGAHSITATYGGDANTGTSVSAPLAIQIGPQTTTVAVTSQPNPSFLGGPITFTATVVPQVGGTPTGTVSFINSSANPPATLGQGPVLANGTAAFAISSLALGTYSINASYSGDALDQASTTTAALSQTVGAASFVVSASPSSQTVTQGQSALYVIGIQPEGNLTTAVTLTCPPTTTSTTSIGTLPFDSTCVFTPPSVTPGTTNTTVSLAVTTLAPVTSLVFPPTGRTPLYTFGAFGGYLAAFVALCALAIDGLRRKRRSGFARFAMAVALVIAMGMTLASCHKSSTATATSTGTPAGGYLITVTGTSGTITSTTNLTLTVAAASN